MSDSQELIDLLEPGAGDVVVPRINELPPPPGATREQIEAVLGPKADNRLYLYHDLAERMSQIPDDRFVPTFTRRLDEVIDGGFRGGELVILSGPTKAGKTTYAQTMSYLQAHEGFPSVWFTLEMSWQELTRKFMAMDEGYAKNQKPTVLPLLYPIDNTLLSLTWLEKQIIKAKKENFAMIAYIDHLHFLMPLADSKGSNVSFAIGAIVREVKKIAIKLDIPIVLIAHTKKMEPTEVPNVNSIRDASFIAQESDYAIIIWRERLEMAIKNTSNSSNKRGPKESAAQKLAREISESDYEDTELYTDKTFVSLETNRRNGKTRRFTLFFKNGALREVEHQSPLPPTSFVKASSIDENPGGGVSIPLPYNDT